MKNIRFSGSVTLLVIVFGAIFLGVLLALAGYTLTLNGAQDFAFQKAEASSIAEAGLVQYQWYLGQNPTDTSAPDPSTIVYNNIENHEVGTYTLSIAPDTTCGATDAYTISSIGAPSDAPSVQSTISQCAILSASGTPAFSNWQEQ